MSNILDCLVIGGGQSGLACAHHLARMGLRYLVVDALGRPGDVWRFRPDSLTLFTSRQFCALPGLPMLGRAEGFPSAPEFADHIERYCAEQGLHAEYGVRVTKLSRQGMHFRAESSNGAIWRSKTIINATGSNQRPRIPVFASVLAEDVRQMAASDYRSPRDLGGREKVLIVGDGASGRQIAMALIHAGHRVSLARGRRRKLVNNIVLGRDVFWWLDKAGILRAPTGGVIANVLRKRDPIPAASTNDEVLAAMGARLMPRATGATSLGITFSNGEAHRFDAVLWAGGYQEDNSWIDTQLKALDNYAGSRGLTPEEGMFVVGRKWLSCRASELVLGVDRDARMVVGHVARSLCAK